MINQKDFKILTEQTLHQGFVTVKSYRLQHDLFRGGLSPIITREVAIRPQVAAVLPYDPILDAVVLIEQFRIGAISSAKPWLTEIVAGILDTDETLEQLAHRETQEEAGLRIEDLHFICQYWSSPGASDERVKLFCAKVDASQAGGVSGKDAENEDILVKVLSSEEVFARMNEGKIDNALAIIALQWLQLHRAELKAKWLGAK